MKGDPCPMLNRMIPYCKDKKTPNYSVNTLHCNKAPINGIHESQDYPKASFKRRERPQAPQEHSNNINRIRQICLPCFKTHYKM